MYSGSAMCPELNNSPITVGNHGIHLYSLHSLLKDGIPPGLANDQIGPLDDYNAGKEGCVAGKLNNLSALICLNDGRMVKK